MSAKYLWSSAMVVAATLVAGCTGMIDTPVPGKPNANGVDNGNPGGPGGPGAGGSTGGPGTDPTVCVPGVPQTSQLPRLTNVQYENTLVDLLGVPGTSSMLAPDTEAVDQRAWDAYKTAAQTVAAQVMADANLKAKMVSCTPAGDDGGACATQIIQTFGQRVFRRPLTELEVARFQKMWTDRATITPTGSFDETMELMLRSFLISPSFLLRSEITEAPSGQYLALSSYEVANRLSYMLLGSMPDDGLFAAAAANALSTPEQIRTEALRLLQDPRARARVTGFHEHYMHMGPGTRWADYLREVPGFSADMVPALSAETDRLFEYLVFEQGGSFSDFLKTPVAFVNSLTAPLYGLNAADYAASGTNLVQVNLDAAQRPGVFTRAGFLASHSVVNRPSPILRGAFLQKFVLCTTVGSPPPGAEGTPLPEVSPTASNRERVDAQTASTECAACHHNLINPTGHVFEAFDALGQYRTTDQFSGQAVDTSALVYVGDAGSVQVTGPAELMDAIAASPNASLCYARAMVQAGYGRGLTSEDSCVAEDMATKLTAGGYRILDLLADLTQADSFRYRAVPEAL